jgi:hypothetical protein
VISGEGRSPEPRLELGTLNHPNSESPENTALSRQAKRTLNDISGFFADERDTGKGWYTKVTTFTSGDVECVALKLDSDQAMRKGGGAKRDNTEKTEMNEVVLHKSQARAKKQVRYKSMMMDADRMLTLTYRENITDLSRAWSDLKAFSRKMKSEFNEDWQYICVPEFQKRGAVHFHMAIAGYLPVNKVRQFWREVVGEGNIDITSPRKTIDKNSWNPKRIANYLAKYITKNDSVEFNKRRYSSTNIPKPPFVTGWLPITIGLSVDVYLSRIIRTLSNREPTDFYETNESYFPLVIVST